MNEALLGGKPTVEIDEFRFLRADQTYGYYRIRGAVQRDEKGAPLAVLGATIDISEQLKREELHGELASIVEQSNDAIVSSHLDGTIRSWNRSAELMHGYKAEEMIGRNICLLIPDELKGEIPDLRGRLQRGETIKNYETLRLKKDGSRIPVSLSLTILRNALGEPIGVSAIARDISSRRERIRLLEESEGRYRALAEELQRDVAERRAAEERLKQTSEELARSNAELDQFAHIVSHDLREPLRMVSSFVTLLSRKYRGRLDADADEFIGFAVDGAQRAKRLVDSLLAYSRAAKIHGQFKAVELGEVLEEVLADLKLTIDSSRATVTVDPLPTVKGDAAQLGQLFQNLISNAIRFRRAETPHIHVSAELREGVWYLSVKDNGIGINKEYTDNLFHLFPRRHHGGTFPSTGVGLAICKRIVERHGGRIWADSEEGRGSVFYFSLPSSP